jgi:hypothetical protein
MERLSLQIILHASNGRYKPVLCVSESENDNSVAIQSAFDIGRPVFMNS